MTLLQPLDHIVRLGCAMGATSKQAHPWLRASARDNGPRLLRDTMRRSC